ncbi:hypothetical protein P43SY_010796 [Pythium insidiosum]|uniref:Reverse transcriptase n=1 Tax=Pythium insidiosum TaxID=114742 RepID=A0AAD5L993_PYTIN|nr:hypothetical protein P43SY_010796 [Pythium insidiosum]
MLNSIRPRKAIPATRYQLPRPAIPVDSAAWVASFDGSAKPKNGGASCGALLWQTPSWSVLLAEALALLRKFDKVFLVHVARAYNAAADWITGKTLQRRAGGEIAVEGMVAEVLYHYHSSLAGGHQGVTPCPDCQSGKGDPRADPGSPGNLVETRPFDIVGMDHAPSLPRSHRGNSELLVWVDHFTGYLIVSANPSREAPRSPRLMRAVRLFVADPDQRDWDYAERLVFALNTSYDRTRRDTTFYLLHGWDARTTLETVVPLPDEVESLPVRPGVSKELAHLWHGPFRILERVDQHLVRLEVDNVTYKFFPMVHTSRLKLWRVFSGRPTEALVDPGSTRLDFDEALLPEDSFDPDEARGDWVPEADLNAAGLLDDYEQEMRARGRFEMMATEVE